METVIWDCPLTALSIRSLSRRGAASVPEILKQQLAVGGRMVIPVGDRRHQVMKIVVREGENEYSELEAGNFVFVPMLPGIADEK